MAESASFVELNSATYKPRQGVHLFLLNDALLVAVKRRAGMGSRVRLAADRCFSLNEISIIDLKDGGELHNAIKIKRGKEATIFRGDKAEDKKLILNALKRVAEEMTSKKRKQSLWEAEKRHEVRETGALLHGRDGAAAYVREVDWTRREPHFPSIGALRLWPRRPDWQGCELDRRSFR
jgi:serine/threonine-protein kinase RIO1